LGKRALLRQPRSGETLYTHFTSKVELVRAVLRDKFRELHATLEAITPHAKDDVVTALKSLLAVVQQHVQEIQPSFVRDVRREAPDVFRLVEQLRHDAIQLHFGRVFSAGQQRGLVRKDVPSRILIEILLGVTQVIVNPAKLAELKLTPETGFQITTDVILEGVLTPRGRASR